MLNKRVNDEIIADVKRNMNLPLNSCIKNVVCESRINTFNESPTGAVTTTDERLQLTAHPPDWEERASGSNAATDIDETSRNDREGEAGHSKRCSSDDSAHSHDTSSDKHNDADSDCDINVVNLRNDSTAVHDSTSIGPKNNNNGSSSDNNNGSINDTYGCETISSDVVKKVNVKTDSSKDAKKPSCGRSSNVLSIALKYSDMFDDVVGSKRNISKQVTSAVNNNKVYDSNKMLRPVPTSSCIAGTVKMRLQKYKLDSNKGSSSCRSSCGNLSTRNSLIDNDSKMCFAASDVSNNFRSKSERCSSRHDDDATAASCGGKLPDAMRGASDMSNASSANSSPFSTPTATSPTDFSTDSAVEDLWSRITGCATNTKDTERETALANPVPKVNDCIY